LAIIAEGSYFALVLSADAAQARSQDFFLGGGVENPFPLPAYQQPFLFSMFTDS